ncbi:MAG: hypothetical protein JW913_15140 [Chitinispirillaceae bacterium]|nr:hypothetical protein [Chitinispirillaceae bacterium]
MLSVLTFGFGPVDAQPITGTIDVGTTYQTMDGFGGSITWYNNWLHQNADKEEICDSLFTDLGIDIVRIKNVYGRSDGAYSESDLLDFDRQTYEAAKSRNSAITFMLNSWSPPAALKDNHSLSGGNNATLIQKKGIFIYGKFADYLVNSFNTYASLGVDVDYVSIQNEPDYDASWESCRFEPQEAVVSDKLIAGYAAALNPAYPELSSLTKIVGPEVTGVGYNKVQNYASALNLNQLDVLSYHLYNGGDPGDPDTYIANLQTIANNYADKTIWQTEFDWPTPFNSAWLIHNTIVEGRASAYLHWCLVWGAPDEKTLIAVNNPWDGDGSGYTINKYYYYFKQFSKFIDAGYKRVAATIGSADIKMSAYVAPDDSRLTAVIINKGAADQEVALDFGSFPVTESNIYRTSNSENFVAVGSLGANNTVQLPAMSVSTVVIGEVADTSDTSTPPPPPPPPPPDDCLIHVEDIQLTTQSTGPLTQGVATILVHDGDGNPVSGVSVSVEWSGIISFSNSGTTEADGTTTLYSAKTKKSGEVTVTVVDLVSPDCTYWPADNIVTSKSITF